MAAPNPFLTIKAPWLRFLQEALDAKATQLHTHVIADITDFVGGGGPHVHPIAEVTGLQAALDAKEVAGTAAAAVAAHAAAGDPHPTYLTLVEGDALYESVGAVAAHEAALDPHPAYLRPVEADLLYEAIGAVATHAGALDPHPAYQREAEKNAALGYPGLDALSKLDGAQQKYGSAGNTACEGNDARLSDARAPTAHKTSHQDGGGDEISLAGLGGEAADAQKVTVRKNTGANVGTRRRLNLIEGANVTLTVAEDAANEEIDITIAAAAGGAGGDISLAPGSFTVATGTHRIGPYRLITSGAERITTEGTGRFSCRN